MRINRKRLLIVTTLPALILITYIKFFTYLPLEGTVVDAETRRPIEGAVIFAEWTIAPMAWIGLPTTSYYRLFETTTNQNGQFKIKVYVFNPIVNKPTLTIYKAEYVCWKSSYIFPGNNHRDGFKWKSNTLYPLEKFKTEYSHADHVEFIGRGVPILDARDPFEKAYEWERMMRQEELRKKKHEGRT